MADIVEAQKACRKELEERMGAIDSILRSAWNCLSEDEYFQCAVRIEEIEKYTKFPSYVEKILESLSEG